MFNEAVELVIEAETAKEAISYTRKKPTHKTLPQDLPLLSLTDEVPSRKAMVRDGRYVSISQSAWKAMDNQAKQAVTTEVMSNVAKSIGFLYGRFGSVNRTYYANE